MDKEVRNMVKTAFGPMMIYYFVHDDGGHPGGG